jgi:hypothetical protein
MSSDNLRIHAVLIIEVMGRPPENVTAALSEIINKISEEEGTSIISQKINEPIELENQKGLYTNYAEVEIEVKSPLVLSGLMFRYMPSHVEVISPENFYMTNVNYTELLSEITRRLHVYDNVARVLQMEKSIVEKKLAELSQSKLAIETKPKEKLVKKDSKKKQVKKK